MSSTSSSPKARLCLAQWAVGDGQETEPEVLKAHRDELFTAYPTLQRLTGDALFGQRPLARRIVEASRAYRFAVEDHPPDLLETARTAFADATPETADAGAREKRGRGGDSAAGPCDRRLRPGGPVVPRPEHAAAGR